MINIQVAEDTNFETINTQNNPNYNYTDLDLNYFNYFEDQNQRNENLNEDEKIREDFKCPESNH